MKHLKEVEIIIVVCELFWLVMM